MTFLTPAAEQLYERTRRTYQRQHDDVLAILLDGVPEGGGDIGRKTLREYLSAAFLSGCVMAERRVRALNGQ